MKVDHLQAQLPNLAKSASNAAGRQIRRRSNRDAIDDAIDIDLVIPLRPQDLSSLTWQRNFSEPDGPRGRLLLHTAARKIKNKSQDLVAEIPDDAAKRLRWYRRHILQE